MEQSNDTVDIITRAFPSLTAEQIEAYRRLRDLYLDWNAKINVISRADTANLYTRHVLHSLAIAAFLGPLPEGTEILDLGTGGGFPGIPLAIFYPHYRFHLIDRIGKKIRVATDIAQQVGLRNVTFQHGDSGECRRQFSYVVSRAVMPLGDLVKAAAHCINPAGLAGRYAPGIVCLKGGELDDELKACPRAAMTVDVADFFNDEFFVTKKIVYVPFKK